MNAAKPGRGSPVIPTFRYQDAPAAIEWLCRMLGFEAHLIVSGEADGIVAHAQLTLGNGMIMLGSARYDDYHSDVRPPVGFEAPLTQAAYLVVSDVDAHYARAKAARALIVMELAEQDYGGKLFACRDPEGQLWNIGSYDPWAGSGG